MLENIELHFYEGYEGKTQQLPQASTVQGAILSSTLNKHPHGNAQPAFEQREAEVFNALPLILNLSNPPNIKYSQCIMYIYIYHNGGWRGANIRGGDCDDRLSFPPFD